jgi:ribose transport system ATP-binding protein
MSNLLEFSKIDKQFPGVKALDNVSMSFRAGEVHALVGENGAGKSTLMKILSGVYQPSGGEIIYKGEQLKLQNPHHAQMQGISIIFQEFSLINTLDVVENVFLNREPKTKLGLFNKKKASQMTKELLQTIGIEIDITAKIKDLSVIEQQTVEIIKALSIDADIIIMDEPSAALSDKELNKLFDIIKKLQTDGKTVIYISHMLEEVFAIADRVTVLKDGRVMATEDVCDLDKDKLVSLMVGCEIGDIYPPLSINTGKVVLGAEDLASGKLRNVNLTLNKGEVLGIAGIAGSGRTALVETLLGIERKVSGTVSLNGRDVDFKNIHQAIDSGFCYIPSDRKNQGIIAPESIVVNTTITNLDAYVARGLINKKTEEEVTKTQVELLGTKVATIDQKIEDLSGGNQQKVLLSRALLMEPEIYIINEPTRGIDVGAKHEIYKIMRDLTSRGKSIIMVSSELPEIIGMSDRILVMNQGESAGILDQSIRTYTEEEILSLAVGHEYKLPAGGCDEEEV